MKMCISYAELNGFRLVNRCIKTSFKNQLNLRSFCNLKYYCDIVFEALCIEKNIFGLIYVE
jgi:hypothetical protein